MDKIPGLDMAFKSAKVIFMTTFDGDRDNTRQMTNYNEDPYGTIWFPTEKDTKKVKDIGKDQRVLLTFPAEEKGEFYEVTGEASFASKEEVLSKWEGGGLYWHPAQRNRFWFPREHDERRGIINVKPVSAKLVKK